MADGTQIQALTTGSASYTYSLNELNGAADVAASRPGRYLTSLSWTNSMTCR